MPKKNANEIKDYLTVLIVEAVFDLEQVSKDITDPVTIEIFESNMQKIVQKFQSFKVLCKIVETKV